MKPDDLRAILDVLRECGVRKASIPVIDDTMMTVRQSPLEVEFDRAPPGHPALLTDPTTGKPVNLDEGAPETAQDIDEAIRRKNFPTPGKPEPGK